MVGTLWALLLTSFASLHQPSFLELPLPQVSLQPDIPISQNDSFISFFTKKIITKIQFNH
jgi:hypothetical protein